MIYVPEFTNNSCCYLYDSNTLRCYDSIPQNNITVNFKDYFVNSHYLSRSGSTQFGSYYTLNFDCIDNNLFTTSYFYRNDATDIMLLFMLIIIFIFGLFGFFWKSFRRGLFA